jgi:hypothetical protein
VFSKSVRAIVWADGFRPFAETKGQNKPSPLLTRIFTIAFEAILKFSI